MGEEKDKVMTDTLAVYNAGAADNAEKFITTRKIDSSPSTAKGQEGVESLAF